MASSFLDAFARSEDEDVVDGVDPSIDSTDTSERGSKRKSYLTFTQPVSSPGQSLQCMFFTGRCGRQQMERVVPLFPAYEAFYGDKKLPNNWLDISTSSLWMCESVKKTVGASQRGKKEQIVAELQRDIKKALRATRGVDDSSIIADDGVVKRDFLRKQPTVVIKLDGTKITCMNNMKKFYISVDTDSVQFLQTRISTACQSTAKSDSDASPTDTGTEASGTDSPAAGTKKEAITTKKHAKTTPNLRGRIWWHPDLQTYLLDLRKVAKGKRIPEKLEFAVAAHFTGDAYDAERERLYKAAITAWNDVDGTNRDRIVLKKQ